MNHQKNTREEYKKAWISPFGIALLVYYFAMAIIGILIPDDILTNHAWAREYSDFMADIVPQIDRITALNINPDVNRFYFSVLWTGVPILILLIVVGALIGGVNKRYIKRSDSILRIIVGITLAVIMALYAISASYIDPSMKLSLTIFATKIGMSFYGQILLVNGPVLLLVSAVFLTPYFLISGKYTQAVKDVAEEIKVGE